MPSLADQDRRRGLSRITGTIVGSAHADRQGPVTAIKRVAGLTTLALTVAACNPFGGSSASENPSSAPTINPDASALASLKAAIASAEASAAAEPTAVPEVIVNIHGILLNRVPTEVDPSKVAQSKSHRIDLGSQMILDSQDGADLLVGSDFDPDLVASSGGAIHYLDASTQIFLNEDRPYERILPEGGVIRVSWQEGLIQIGDKTYFFPEIQKNNYLVFVKGSSKCGCDGKGGGDKKVTLTGFVPGHAEVEDYPARTDGKTPFVSEGQFSQQVTTALLNADTITAVFIDYDTGAYSVIIRRAIKDKDPYAGWEALGSNWWNDKITQKANTSNDATTVFDGTMAYSPRRTDVSPVRVASQTQPSYQGSFARVGGGWKR